MKIQFLDCFKTSRSRSQKQGIGYSSAQQHCYAFRKSLAGFEHGSSIAGVLGGKKLNCNRKNKKIISTYIGRYVHKRSVSYLDTHTGWRLLFKMNK
jgi:hypothetical protein